MENRDDRIKYIVWSTDSNGNYYHQSPHRCRGSSSTVQIAGAEFPARSRRRWHDWHSRRVRNSHRILRADQAGSGRHATIISHSVSSNSGPELKCYGAPVVAGQFGAWTPIGTEQTASGYQVVWKIRDGWTATSSGAPTATATTSPTPRRASGTSSTIKALETSFQQDLNGDGVISVGSSVAARAAGSLDISQVAPAPPG